MYSELQDKVVVISGAGGALGAAVVSHFHQEGSRLALIDRATAAMDSLMLELGLPADRYLIGGTDLTQPVAVEDFVTQTLARFGRIDVLVNLVGGFRFSGPTYQADPGDLDAMFTINVKTAYLLSTAVMKRMVETTTPGRVVLVGARAALTGAANMAAYAASKAAVNNLVESMAAEMLPHGITVNAVLPSTIDTPANRQATPDADFNRWVKPDSLAGVIAFLVSDAARDISGAAIPVYGRS
jgi:NAD(P)-dependent dehydrogenase (short-subunit alcohol dehydrogenase family)